MTSNISPRHILVVDEDDFVRYSVAQILRAHHAEVETASSTREGLRALSTASFDCIVFHLHSKELDPFSFVDAVRQEAPQTPMIATSELGSQATDRLAKEIGCIALLVKPIDPESLRTSVEKAMAQGPGAPDDFPTPRIIVVDDEELVLFTVKHTLMGPAFGTEIETFESPLLALAALRSRNFDVLLVDLRMPDLGGIDLIKAAKKLNPLIVPIILTGIPELDTAISAVRASVFDYLMKPIEPEALRRVVSRAWAMRRLGQQRYRLFMELERSYHELERNAAALDRSRRYSEGIITNFLDTLIVVDSSGLIQTVNQETLRVLGYAASDLVGKPMATVFPETSSDDLLGPEGMIGKVLNTGSIRNLELMYQTKDRRRVPMSFSASVMRDEAGSSLGIVAGAKDMTEIREQNRRLLDLQAQLVESERIAALGHLSAGVARELGNPLSVLFWSLQHLCDRLPSSDPVSDFARAALKEAERLLALIQGMLATRAGGRGPVREADFSAIVSDALRVAEVESDRRRIRVDTTFEPNLPRITVSPEAIHRLLLNLINTSFEALGDKGGTIRLRTFCQARHGALILEVEDDGPPVSSAVIEDMYRPFQSAKAGGTGLGLYLSRCIAQDHGGRLEVENLPPGVRFRLELPNSDQETIPSHQVLVVDGEEHICSILARLLEDRGHAVRTAITGEQALIELKSFDCHLAIVDYRLPDTDGLSLIGQMIGQKPYLRAILMTSFGSPELASSTQRAKVEGYLEKPFSDEALIAIVERAISAAPSQVGSRSLPGVGPA